MQQTGRHATEGDMPRACDKQARHTGMRQAGMPHTHVTDRHGTDGHVTQARYRHACNRRACNRQAYHTGMLQTPAIDTHVTDGHATDGPATDRHATDGPATDRHATQACDRQTRCTGMRQIYLQHYHLHTCNRRACSPCSAAAVAGAAAATAISCSAHVSAQVIRIILCLYSSTGMSIISSILRMSHHSIAALAYGGRLTAVASTRHHRHGATKTPAHRKHYSL